MKTYIALFAFIAIPLSAEGAAPLQIYPEKVVLVGPRDEQRLIVQAGGDATREAKYASSNPKVASADVPGSKRGGRW